MSRAASNVLVDNWFERRSLALDLVWIAGFSLLTGGLAHVRIPLPFTPVPLTGQTFAVLLSGAALGSRRAFLSQALYLVEGAARLPVFRDRKSTRLNSSHGYISYAVFCLKKKKRKLTKGKLSRQRR